MWTLNGTDKPSAGNDHAVVLVCDAGFFPVPLYLARQIARCHPERTFDLVIVCSETVPLPSGLPAEDVRIVTASGTPPFEHLPNSARRSNAAYLCLMLPHLLPDYARIAYLDCDIAVAIPGLDQFPATRPAGPGSRGCTGYRAMADADPAPEGEEGIEPALRALF